LSLAWPGIPETRKTCSSDVVAAVAPIVGTARVASATGNIARALGVAIEVAELEEEAEADV
jgi:hypothetical protein